MALAKEDVEQIQAIVLQTINNTPEFKNANVRYEIDLRERTIRVEEELKHQRELMQEGFKQMEKRFEQVDKRFEQMSLDSDKRFTEMNRRLDRFMFWSLGITVSCALFVVTYLQ
jgi:DNA anti-recombination protein RmuC